MNSIRRKILRNNSLTVTSTDVYTDNKGRDYIILSHSDVIRINSVTVSADDPRTDANIGNTVTTEFTFDNGQRDYTYEHGRLYFTNSFFLIFILIKVFNDWFL